MVKTVKADKKRSDEVKQAAEIELESKFFLIVDGNDGICLVGVSPPTVRYLTNEMLKFIRQQLDIPFTASDESLPVEEITARLSGVDLHPDVLAWMKEIRLPNSSGKTKTGNFRSARACISGAAPIELIVGRGTRG